MVLTALAAATVALPWRSPNPDADVYKVLSAIAGVAALQTKLQLTNRVQIAAWAWEHRHVT